MASRPLAVGDRVWKAVEGWPYEVSNDGEARNAETKQVLTGGFSSTGYRAFSVVKYVDGVRRQANVRIHIAVAAAFLGPRPDGHVINHKNGIKTDNRVENLEYCTPRENRDHAMQMRLYKSGTKAPWSKLTPEQVRMIRDGRAIGMSANQLARAFDVSKRAVQLVCQGKNWKYADEEVTSAEQI